MVIVTIICVGYFSIVEQQHAQGSMAVPQDYVACTLTRIKNHDVKKDHQRWRLLMAYASMNVRLSKLYV